MSETIGKFPATAPMFNNAGFMHLRGIVELLSKASYHFADDSGIEWSDAKLALSEAAAEINKLKLRHDAISAIHAEVAQIFPVSVLFDAVLKDARK